MSVNSAVLRHFLASLAYHASKAIKDVPENYPELDTGMGVRTPRHILHHITGVLSYADSFYKPYETTYFPMKPWGEEVESFYASLKNLDESLKIQDPKQGF